MRDNKSGGDTTHVQLNDPTIGGVEIQTKQIKSIQVNSYKEAPFTVETFDGIRYVGSSKVTPAYVGSSMNTYLITEDAILHIGSAKGLIVESIQVEQNQAITTPTAIVSSVLSNSIALCSSSVYTSTLQIETTTLSTIYQPVEDEAIFGKSSDAKIVVEGNRAYIANSPEYGKGYLIAYDISDIKNPQLLNHYDIDYGSWVGVAAKDFYVFARRNDAGMEIIDFQNPNIPNQIKKLGGYGRGNTFNLGTHIEICNDLLIDANSLYESFIYDISNLPIIEVVGVYRLSGAKNIEIGYSGLFVVAPEEVGFFDISEPPLSPIPIGSYDPPW